MSPWISIAALLAVAAITPGPNNVLVAQAAVRGGRRAAMVTIVAVLAGSMGLFAVAWAGVVQGLGRFPALRFALTVAGAAYLVWLGLQPWIRQDGSPSSQLDRPRGLQRAAWAVAAFQFSNPKAWLLVGTAVAAVSGPDASATTAATLLVLIVMITTVCLAVWAWLGTALEPWISTAARRRRFDRAMGALLALTALLLVA